MANELISVAEAWKQTHEAAKKQNTADSITLMSSLFPKLWQHQRQIPYLINHLCKNRLSSEETLKAFSKYALSPMPEAQEMLDLYFSYLIELEKTHETLAQTLRKDMQAAVTLSNKNNIDPMRKAVWEASKKIKAAPPQQLMFPLFCFDSNPKKQIAFTKIMHYQQRLFMHARALKKSGESEDANQFRTMSAHLQEQTFNACYADLDGNTSKQARIMELNKCHGEWQWQLITHHKTADRLVDKSRILDEIGVVLSCLVVLYPVALAINYALTKRIGILCHSDASKVADKVEKRFSVLRN